MIDDFPIGEIVYHAITKNETGLLFEMCQADKSKQLVRGAVHYLSKK
jgi:hypothetical protein